MGKCSKIRHIVRLRQMLRRWRQKAASSSASLKAAPAPPDVPAGHVAVCVGSDCRRFVIRTTHLNHPILRQLLRQAEEEYGFPSRPGPITLPCDEDLFEDVLRHISSFSSSSSTSRSYANLEDFSRLSPSCFSGHAGRCHGTEAVSLLHGKVVW